MDEPKHTTGAWERADYHMAVLADPWYRLLSVMHDNVAHATCQFWRRRGVSTLAFPLTTMNVSSPMEMGSDSTPVRVRFGGIPVYLADSMQFLLEYGCRIARSGCYSFLPSYRGEPADRRHLSQFYNSEVEIPGEIGDAMLLAEQYIRFLCKHVFDGCQDEANSLVGDISHVRGFGQGKSRLPQVTLDEAEALVGSKGIRKNRHRGFRTVTPSGELQLIKEFGGAVWLTKQDHRAVPFYQAFGDDEGRSAKAADLLMGIGELVGLGERHSSADATRRALAMHGLESREKDYGWYLEMRDLHPMTTSGFGLGVERLFCWALKHDDIRDVQPFLRFRGVRPVV